MCIQFQFLKIVRQLNCMELVWLEIVWSGDMRFICRWNESRGKW